MSASAHTCIIIYHILEHSVYMYTYIIYIYTLCHYVPIYICIYIYVHGALAVVVVGAIYILITVTLDRLKSHLVIPYSRKIQYSTESQLTSSSILPSVVRPRSTRPVSGEPQHPAAVGSLEPVAFLGDGMLDDLAIGNGGFPVRKR
jgi:hypothetical protein